MLKTLYLMRHGQTIFNIESLNQGASDSPLLNVGTEQARSAGRLLAARGIQPDHVFSSPYERACDTTEIVTSFLSPDGYPLPYERLKGIAEINVGAYEAKDIYLNPPEPFGDYFVDFGGESGDTVAARMVKTLTEVMRRPDVKVALVVSHGAAIVHFRHACGDKTPADYGIKNCTIFVYTFDEDSNCFTCVDTVEPEVCIEDMTEPYSIDFSLNHSMGDVASEIPDGPVRANPSTPKTLWVVRHAETVFNDQHKIQGWCDSPLTERGREQARICGRLLADVGAAPDHAFCSTAYRTSVTLEIILRELGRSDMSYLRLKRLREVGFGAFEAKDQCIEPSYNKVSDDFFVSFGGERRSNVGKRMMRAITAIMQRGDVGEALIVSHAGSSMWFYMHPAVRRIAPFSAFSNCMVYRYSYDPTMAERREAKTALSTTENDMTAGFTCEEILIPDLSSLERPYEPPQVIIPSL